MLKTSEKLEYAKSGEPVGSSIKAADDFYRVKLITALNWYTREKDAKNAKAYLIEWAKKSGTSYAKAIETTDQNIPVTFGWIARLRITGADLKPSDLRAFDEFVKSLQPRVVVKAAVAVTRPSIQDSIKEKASELLGEFEWFLDQIKLGIFDKNFSTSKYLHSKEIGTPYLPHIDAWARKKLAFYLSVYTSKDAQTKEAYSNFSKADLQRIMVFLKAVVEDVGQYGQVRKANRKPRAKKAIPAGVQVKALKYKREDTDFGLKSINPVDIIGAQQLWVFNTKYRKLGVYRTDSALGLQVKGATLQNYLPDQSAQKTVRKPELVLPTVIDAGKVALRKVLDNINGKEFEMNGRIGPETVLLRVVR